MYTVKILYGFYVIHALSDELRSHMSFFPQTGLVDSTEPDIYCPDVCIRKEKVLFSGSN